MALATTDGVLFQYWVYTATERSDRSQVQSKFSQNQDVVTQILIVTFVNFDLSGQLVDTGAAEAVLPTSFMLDEPIILYQCTGSTVCFRKLFAGSVV